MRVAAAVQANGEESPQARALIKECYRENVKKDKVEKAIAKGKGEGGTGPLERLVYECYGPGSVAMLVPCYTDNRRRMAQEMRAMMNAHNCALAKEGAVSFLFSEQAVVTAKRPLGEDDLLEAFVEGGGEDIEVNENGGEGDGDGDDEDDKDEFVGWIFAEVAKGESVANALRERLGDRGGDGTVSVEIQQRPSVFQDVGAEDEGLLHQLIETLEEHPEVEAVWHNARVGGEN